MTGPGDTRQRAVALIEEAGTLLGMIPRLLDDSDALRAKAEVGARESEALRAEVEALKGELQQLRTEREDLADILARIATDMGRLGEIVSRPRAAGERKSPFWRDPNGGPAGAPAGSAPGTPAWR